VAPLDRGFLYGDAIYEVWRTYHGVVFAWEEHWARLEASGRALHFPVPWTRERMGEEIRRTVAAFRAAGGAGEVYIRLQATRGAGPIGLDIGLAEGPVFVLLVQACPELSATQLSQGLTLSIVRELRRNPATSLDPAWKTGNYLNNLLGLREAKARGADEAVFLNLAGEIAEAAVCNVAFVRRGVVVTPPLGAGILSGITRRLVLESVAAAAGIEAREETIRPENLGAFEECFLLSTTKDIQPVGRVDDRPFRVGAGTVGQRLKAAFQDYTRRYAAGHPALRVP
jgi:branched-subunit amino acid aminotransferase/4-amino-4-deoxychorismate lyase